MEGIYFFPNIGLVTVFRGVPFWINQHEEEGGTAAFPGMV